MNIQQVQRDNMAQMQAMLAFTRGVPTDQVYAWDMVSVAAKKVVLQVAGVSTHYASEMWCRIHPVERNSIQQAIKRVNKVTGKLLAGGVGVASV